MSVLTVARLLELLQNVPPDAEVRLAYNSGYAYDDAQSVEVCDGHIYISTEEEKEQS